MLQYLSIWLTGVVDRVRRADRTAATYPAG